MKIILIVILSVSYLFSMGKVDTTVTWVELPDRGSFYDISEEDMDVTFQRSLDDYLKNNDIRKQFTDSIETFKTASVEIDTCLKSETVTRYPKYELKEDIKLPSGRVLMKKGTVPNKLFDKSFDFCIFDGSNDKKNDLLMNFYKKDCIFMANNKNVDELSKKYGKKFYPLSFQVKDKLDLKCLPVQINFNQNKEIYDYINIKDLEDEKDIN